MIQSLLPPNATSVERALESQSFRLDVMPVEIAKLWNPAACPTAFLPWLASGLSVDDWDVTWTEEAKRAYLAASIDIHRHKGTIGAVKRVLSVLGYGDCTITEGWTTVVGAAWVVGDTQRVGGANSWAEYWLTVHVPVTPAQVALIARRLAPVAPAHCHLTHINIENVTVTVGGLWAVGATTVTVGATYPITEIYNGIAA